MCIELDHLFWVEDQFIVCLFCCGCIGMRLGGQDLRSASTLFSRVCRCEWGLSCYSIKTTCRMCACVSVPCVCHTCEWNVNLFWIRRCNQKISWLWCDILTLQFNHLSHFPLPLRWIFLLRTADSSRLAWWGTQKGWSSSSFRSFVTVLFDLTNE